MANLTSDRFTRGLALITFLLAFSVVVLGAYTRLKDAGLGCPDWPGCYGHFTVPESSQSIQKADLLYPQQPVEPAKAWPEMIHRYAAGTLGTLILILALTAIFRRKIFAVPLLLILFVIFQAMLGMWTVTLKLLPQVVMGHLLMGLTVLSLLWVLKKQVDLKPRLPDLSAVKNLRPWAFFGLLIVAIQIALGGWTSSNYAALVCPTFPFCQGQLLPLTEFHKAFNLFMPVGANFQGGVLDTAARVTIQMMHRLGGLITGIYLLLLCSVLIFSRYPSQLRAMGGYILLFLVIQICLGILNVILLLPLPVAVAHNAGAALLLLSLVSLNYLLYAKSAN